MLNKSEKIRTIIWIVLLLYAFVVIAGSSIKLNRVKTNYNENVKIKMQLEEDTALAKELYELSDDAYVEKKAREQLGYQYPDEIIYRSIN